MTFLQLANAQTIQAQCSVTGASSLEPNQSTVYSVQSVTGASYFWSVTGGLSISGSNTGASVSVIAGNQEGFGQVCVTRFKAGSQPSCCCLPVEIKSNGVIDPPPGCPSFSPFIYSSNKRTGEANTICSQDLAAVGVSGPMNGHTVQWTVSPSVSVTLGTLNSSYFEFRDNLAHTSYTITATFYNAQGCVTGGGTLYVNETTENCGWIYPTGIEEDIQLYPNPNNGTTAKLKLPKDKKANQVDILNPQGERMYQYSGTDSEIEWELGTWPIGLYYVRVSRDGKLIKQLQLVKQ